MLLYCGKSCCTRAKEVVFIKSGCIRANVVVFRQSGCIRAKVVVYGQSGCFGEKVVVLGQSGCILAKVVVFGQSGCIRAKVVVSCKIVVFGKTLFFKCARLAQLVRSLTANREVPGSCAGLATPSVDRDVKPLV